MAQIIKHRRGSLEALSAVTSSLQKGEIVIASGSSNLSVTNGASIVFAVPENGQVQAVNRFLQGNSAPNNFAAGTYNGMLNGVPYYASGSSTLYLLGEGANLIPNLVGNIQPFSASVAVSINALSSSIGGGSIGTSVNALNAFTASQLEKDSALATYTASVSGHIADINAYTASNNTTNTAQSARLSRLEESTSSLNAFSASQLIKDSTLQTYTASVNAKFDNVQASTASLNLFSASINTFTASENTKSETLRLYTASIDTKFSTLATYTGSNDTTNTAQNARLSRLEESTASLNSLTSSYARTNTANVFTGNQTITGSLFITQDLIVQGSSSIQTISSSRLDIGDNIIQLNVNSPSLRFGGIAVYDSGSVGMSGSFLYDSVEDEFIFVHKGNGTNVTSSHFVLGPETYDSLGNETYLTNNRVPKGTGKEHLNDSNITDTGTLITLGSNTVVAGTLVASGTSLVSSSAQINYTQLSGISANIISASTDSDNVDFIISGGSITANLKGGVVSGSSQIDVTSTTNFSSYSSSVSSSISALSASVGSGNVGVSITNLNSFSASQLVKDTTLAAYTASVDTKFTTLQAYTASIDTKFTTLQSLTASNATRFTRIEESTASLNAFSASENTKSETLRLYTASVDTKFSTLATYTASIDSKFTAVQTQTASINGHITDINTWSASVKGHITDINSYTASNNTTNTAQNNRLSSIETFTSSFGTTFSSSVDSRLDTLEGTGGVQGVGTGNEVTFAKITTTGNAIIGGDLIVQGNTVSLNTSTLTIEDKLITLASGSTNNGTADGAGFEVAGTSAKFTYNGTTNEFSSSVGLSANVTGSINIPGAGSSKRLAFRNTVGNIDFVAAPTTAGDIAQWNGTDFVMSNVIDGGSF
jgi:hypothetical protein